MIEDNGDDGRFSSCWQKLGRAKAHLDELPREISRFYASSQLYLEPVAGDSEEIVRLQVRRLGSVSAAVSLIAGDAAHNIRSALDHFAWAAASSGEHGTRTCFPVPSAATIDSGAYCRYVERSIPGARLELIRAVAMLEPWEGGADQGLWVVHELDRVDKHRLVLSTAVTLGRIELHGDSYDLTTVKRHAGFDVNRPLPMEPIEWTPIAEGAVLTLPLADAQPTPIDKRRPPAPSIGGAHRLPVVREMAIEERLRDLSAFRDGGQ